jgi:hypothetical protein
LSPSLLLRGFLLRRSGLLRCPGPVRRTLCGPGALRSGCLLCGSGCLRSGYLLCGSLLRTAAPLPPPLLLH